MKSHCSNKSYNSRLTRWIDRLLPFIFKIDHFPGTRMGLVDYISRQPNQKAESITQYDEEFMVATLSRISDAITTLFSNSPQIPFQKQHNNSKRKLLLNKTQVHTRKFANYDAHIPSSSNNSFTTKARVNIYNSKIISSFNRHANHFNTQN